MAAIFLRNTLLLSMLALLVACTYVTPYKLEIQQGTVLTQEMVSKLKPGMTRSQVSFVLGTPLLTDAFHADRWDYVYYVRKRGKLTDQRQLALFFADDKLSEIRGDVKAGAAVAPDAAATPAAPAPAPGATPAAAPADTKAQ